MFCLINPFLSLSHVSFLFCFGQFIFNKKTSCLYKKKLYSVMNGTVEIFLKFFHNLCKYGADFLNNCIHQLILPKTNTVNVLYLACSIFGIFQIFCYLAEVDLYPFIPTFINAHLAEGFNHQRC